MNSSPALPRKKRRLSRFTTVCTTQEVSQSQHDAKDSGASGHLGLYPADVYVQLRERFENVKIHVDDPFDIPKYVWYQDACDDDLLGDCKYTVTVESDEPIGTMTVKKSFYSTKEKRAYLRFADLHIDQVTDCLALERNPKRWIKVCTEQNVKVEADDLLETLRLTYQEAAVSKFIGSLHLAFVGHMHNSVGRSGLYWMLEFVGKIAFGAHFADGVKIQDHIFPFTAEGFPVSYNTHTPLRSRSRSASLPNDSSRPDRVLCSHSRSHSHSHSRSFSSEVTNAGSMVSTKGHVYSDVTVISTNKDGWVKYLLVCELRSGYGRFSDKEISQLFCQMLGACMHQTEVFGLIMNAARARLYKLEHRPDEKEVVFYEPLPSHFYNFVCPRGYDAFQTKNLKKLFHDLVGVLQYGKENINEVKPLPHH